MKKWQLQTAKNCLSEVIEKALKEGPQVVTRRGADTAIVLSIKDYQKLASPKENIVSFFRSSPLVKAKLNLDRNPDLGRDITL